MPVIPLYSLLIVYAIIVILYIIFAIFNFLHIFESASFTTVSFIVSFFILISTIIVLIFTGIILHKANIDWSQSLFDAQTLSNIPTSSRSPF